MPNVTAGFARRVGLPSLLLPVFYWALFVPAGPGLPNASAPAGNPEQMRRLVEQARSRTDAGKFEQALEPALQLTAAEPENHAYLRSLANIYHELGKFADEARTWEAFEEHAPVPTEACPQIGIAYLKLPRIEDAARALEHCFELDNSNADVIFYLALASERTGNTSRAAELYRTGLKIAPDYPDLQIGLARTELHLGKPAEAFQAVGPVLARDPSNLDALLVAGLSSWRTGHRQAAREYLEKGARLSPGYADFRTALDGMNREERVP